MVTVYGGLGSRAFRVLWLLRELELEHTHIVARPHSPEVSALNPLGQVPVVTDDDLTLTDSVAILHYFSDRYEKFTFAPGTPERVLMDGRINFVLTELEAPIWLMAKHGFVLPEAERHGNMRAIAEPDFARGEGRLADLLGDAEFIAGDTFTVADIVAGQTLSWAGNAKISLKSQRIKDYLARLQSRPAWQKVHG